MTGGTPAALRLSGLQVQLETGATIVSDLELCVQPREILGLVGESGSGKSTVGRAMLGYAEPGVAITSGDLSIAGEVVPLNEGSRMARGRLVTYVPQNPGGALNPALRVRATIEDMLAAHRPNQSDENTVASKLTAVGLPSRESFSTRFPHQLSGGQQQRVCIAVSLACDPAVVVLDEPTTGLDVVTQAHILRELLLLRKERGLSMMYITHDLSVVAQIADRIAVMYAGNIVEEGPAARILSRPVHPYTRGLLLSIPDHAVPVALDPMPGTAPSIDEELAGCPFAPRCAQVTAVCHDETPARRPAGTQFVRCHHSEETPAISRADGRSPPTRASDNVVLKVTELHAEHRTRAHRVVVASNLSFELRRAECVALVGESGSGKTTIARAIAGLHPISGGEVILDGEELSGTPRHRSRAQLQRVQLIFQNPAEALNPRHTVRSAIARPARLFQGLRGSQLHAEVDSLLAQVRLPLGLASRFPAEISGGERQRVAIARALAAQPEVLLCDEITSALDVSVQAAILELLLELRVSTSVALLFITHDLGVVRLIADRVIVLKRGNVCETGSTERVLDHPRDAYTQSLLAAAPSFSRLRASADAASSRPSADPEPRRVQA